MSSSGGCEPNVSLAGMLKSSMKFISCLPPIGTYTPWCKEQHISSLPGSSILWSSKWMAILSCFYLGDMSLFTMTKLWKSWSFTVQSPKSHLARTRPTFTDSHAVTVFFCLLLFLGLTNDKLTFFKVPSGLCGYNVSMCKLIPAFGRDYFRVTWPVTAATLPLVRFSTLLSMISWTLLEDV